MSRSDFESSIFSETIFSVHLFALQHYFCLCCYMEWNTGQIAEGFIFKILGGGVGMMTYQNIKKKTKRYEKKVIFFF